MRGRRGREDRLVKTLTRERLIAPDAGRQRLRRGVVLTVSGAVLFGGGLGTGLWSRQAADARPAFVLLLYSSPGMAAGGPDRVAEYGAWARERHVDGEVVDGAELGPVLATLGPRVEAAEPQGFFMVRAASPAAALRLARGSPHLKYGGAVVVRAVPGSA